MFAPVRFSALTAISLMLAACGGGGSDSTTTRSFTSTPSNISSGGGTTITSGGSTSGTGGTSTPQDAQPNFTGFSNAPADGEVVLEAQTVGADISVDGFFDDVTIGTVITSGGSTARYTNENGEVVAFRVNGANVEVDVPNQHGDSISNLGTLYSAEDSSRQNMVLVVNPEHEVFEYEHQTYGAWITDYGSSGAKLGAGSFGARTAASDLPQGQTATYRGTSQGFARLSNGEAHTTVSAVQVDTDFSTVNIQSAGTRTVNVNSGLRGTAPELDFQGSGQVNGATFTADISGTGTSGTADGRFYGPNAEEVGGTFNASGSGGIHHIGAFGGN